MDSIDPAVPPLVRAAARGELPEWTAAGTDRREHMRRVADLMSQWAEGLGLAEEDRIRWAAAGWLHDSLKEADPDELRAAVPDRFRDLPDALLHGPAAAEKLQGEAGTSIREAIRYHTIGHPGLDRLGRALYLADFLEPARKSNADWRARLRGTMPDAMDDVLPRVVRARVDQMADRGHPVRQETLAFLASLQDPS